MGTQIRYEETPWGFNYGAAEVTRIHSDGKRQWVMLGITTPKVSIQVYVTKTGKLRVFSRNTEWFPAKKGK